MSLGPGGCLSGLTADIRFPGVFLSRRGFFHDYSPWAFRIPLAAKKYTGFPASLKGDAGQ
jgi:hypothetical protein